MIEAEAKAKWCPWSRMVAARDTPSGGTVHDGTAAGYNRLAVVDSPAVVIPNAAKCIASHCMAWRWTSGRTTGGREGYCGPAGKEAP